MSGAVVLVIVAALVGAVIHRDATTPAVPSATPARTATVATAASTSPTASPTEAPPLPPALRSRLAATPGVGDVLAAVDAADSARLVSLAFHQPGYCEYRPPNATPTPITPASAYGASNACRVPGATTYEGISVAADLPGALNAGLELWSDPAFANVARALFAAQPRLVSVSDHAYRLPALDATGFETRHRYTLWYELTGDPGLSGAPIGDAAASGPSAERVNGFALEVDTGEAQPVAALELLHRDAWPAPDALDAQPPHRRVTQDAGASVRAALAGVPRVRDVLAAADSGDVDRLLALFQTHEAICIRPPLPAHEIPELCGNVGDPANNRYTAFTMDVGTTFPASRQRTRALIGALFIGGAPRLEGAWHFVRRRNGAVVGDTYYIALAGLAFEAPRAQLSLGAYSWDSVVLEIDPGAAKPIVSFAIRSPQYPASVLMKSLVRGASAGSTLEPVR